MPSTTNKNPARRFPGKSTTMATVQELDKSNQRIKKMFAGIAPRYDLMNHVLSANVDRWWRRQTVRHLRITSKLPVLDVCTGTGDLAISMAKEFPDDVRVLGMDFCSEMLDIARDKQKKKNIADTKLQFLEADTQVLPLEDNSVQIVTVAFGLRNVNDTLKGLTEMIRVCKPGGQVVVLEFSKPTVFGLKQMYDWYFRFVLPAIGQTFAKNKESAYAYLPESVRRFPCGQELATLMKTAGLKSVDVVPMTGGIATLYVGAK
jgi:demethylmenaquinone methyltransferase / 2-methoxy-6-polyprenyl-1,4-benzoquinol methylase